MKPLCVDLFCGLGGWTKGFLSEGYECIGFDIEQRPYPGQLVLQDVLTLDGDQFRHAACIVASPPCQAYSYRAMPWKRAKALPPPSNELFDACFRIQREASEAAGRHIPMVVENVCGAQKWVGRARWHFGSYYLWGDVPALMPFTRVLKQPGRNFHFPEKYGIPSPSFHGAPHEESVQRALGVKVPGLNWSGSDEPGYVAQAFNTTAEQRGRDSFGWSKDTPLRNNNSHSSARKAASALIAEIPFDLAQWIARCFNPEPQQSRKPISSRSSDNVPLMEQTAGERLRS